MSEPPPQRTTSVPSGRYASFANSGYSAGGSGAGGDGANAGWSAMSPAQMDEGQLRGATKQIKQDNVQLSQRAVGRLQEAEDTATANLEKLCMQGEVLSNVEHRLDVADAYAEENDAKTSELKRLNRWFFIPAWGGGSKASKQVKMSKGERAQEAYAAEKAARAKQMENMQVRIQAQGSSAAAAGGSSSGRPAARFDPSGPYYKNREYAEEDAAIDRNLDQISSGVSRIKMMATMMNTETEIQSERIARLADKSEMTRERVRSSNMRVERM